MQHTRFPCSSCGDRGTGQHNNASRAPLRAPVLQPDSAPPLLFATPPAAFVPTSERKSGRLQSRSPARWPGRGPAIQRCRAR
eukprot:5702065-Prymnesium_polylepis.1